MRVMRPSPTHPSASECFFISFTLTRTAETYEENVDASTDLSRLACDRRGRNRCLMQFDEAFAPFIVHHRIVSGGHD